MTYLLDTNVISELRKKKARVNDGVAGWFETVDPRQVYLSVLTLGEIRNGIERVRRRGDAAAAQVLENWLAGLSKIYKDRVLPIDFRVSQHWGLLGVPDPVPVIDGLLAATALVHGLIFVTRNVADIRSTGVEVLNPFS